jgi:hypothetical protein
MLLKFSLNSDGVIIGYPDLLTKLKGTPNREVIEQVIFYLKSPSMRQRYRAADFEASFLASRTC